jgi:DNA-binding NtrC family response regulator
LIKNLTGLRILVAEDESLIALYVESTLTDFGCEVIGPLSTVEDVLQRSREGGIDGALLDVNLRGRQIFDVLPDLLQLGMKLILTSGYDDITQFPEVYRTLPRLAKPFGEHALRQTCEANFLS